MIRDRFSDSTRTNVEILDSKMVKGLMQTVNAEFRRKVQVVEEHHEKTCLPMLTGKQITHMIYAFSKINHVQRSSVGFNDVLNTELRGDSVEMSRQAWERDVDGHGEKTG